jgi:O-antigen/teichoic acid export membrane protein
MRAEGARAGSPPRVGLVPEFARSAIATSVTHGGLFALSLLTSVLVARVLGPEGKGVYALVLVFASMFVFFSSFGLHYSAAFFLGRKEYPPAEIFGHTLISLVVLATAVSAVALAARPLLAATLFPGVPRELFYLGIPLIAGQHLFGFLTVILLGLHDIGGYNLMQILRAVGLLLVGGLLLLLGYGVAGILAAEVASWVAVGGLAFVAVFRRIRGISMRYNPGYVRASLRYGLTVYFGHALSFFHYRTALLLLSVLATPAVVGLYSVAAGVAGNLTLLSQGAATVLFPWISADPGAVRNRELTPLVLRTILLVTGGAAVVLALIGPWLIVAVFSAAFAGAGRALQLLLPGAVALCGWSILDSYFKGAGRPVWSAMTTGVAVVLGGALTVVWIPRYGLLGASAATSIGYVASLIVALAAFVRLSGISPAALLLPRRTDFTLYGAVVSRMAGLRPARGQSQSTPPTGRGPF